MKPLVSILIPAYNAGRWIAKTIQSASEQSWPGKEIIVVDDGSSDNTLAIARRFASRAISVVTQENLGASAARNHAFKLCQGEYIQWLDADDLLARDKIARQLQTAEIIADKQTLLSAPFASFLHRVSKARVSPTPLWADLSPLEWLLRKMGQNLHMQTSTWLVSRQLTEAAGPWDTRLSLDDDGEYFCRVLLASNGVRFVPEAKVFYRASGFSSLSVVNASDKKLDSQFLSMQLHVKYLRSLEESERTRAACLKYLQTWFIHFVAERSDLVAELKKVATSLGGTLEVPPIRKKYAWIQPILGYSAAKRAQFFLPRIKWLMLRLCDKALDLSDRRLSTCAEACKGRASSEQSA